MMKLITIQVTVRPITLIWISGVIPGNLHTHTLAQQSSSVYYQLIQDTDEGLYLAQWLSSEITLRYEAVPSETIYPTKCSWVLGTVEHHQRDPKPNNRLQLEPTRIRQKDWMDDIIIWWGLVIGISWSHDFGRYEQGHQT